MKKTICFFIILSQMFLLSYAQDEAESAATQAQPEAIPAVLSEPTKASVAEDVAAPVVQKKEVKEKAVNKKQAQEEEPQEPCNALQETQGTVVLRERVSDQNPLRKISRGAVNTALGWVEIPRQMIKVNKAKGDVAGVFWGPLKGFAFFVGRTAVGIYEVTTFLLPPYKPVVSPEFIFSEDDED